MVGDGLDADDDPDATDDDEVVVLRSQNLIRPSLPEVVRTLGRLGL